jgi:hypothetical protein
MAFDCGCVFDPEQHDLTDTGSGVGLFLLPQHPPCWTGCGLGCGTGFGWQQLDMESFRAGTRRGVELALDGGDAGLLPLPSVGVLV